MNAQKYTTLRSNVSLLGRVLGDTISEASGPEFLDKVELIRNLSKSARRGMQNDRQYLEDVLINLNREELLTVARAFNQFLNLANIADQHHVISREMDKELSATKNLRRVFSELKDSGCSSEEIVEAVQNLGIELVLTAHPTEINRRTLIDKYVQIDHCLAQIEQQGLTEREQIEVDQRLRELVAQIWHTHDFRHSRPTPVDEAKSGFAVVENSLWSAVPEFLRRIDRTLFEATGEHLPVEAAPVSFSSWMGGDRDGNPNVTATVTQEVINLSRWQVIDLYLRDINELVGELSMTSCNSELQSLTDGAHEPYRVVLRRLREKLRNTLTAIGKGTSGLVAESGEIVNSKEDVWDPLYACYQSLIESGMPIIANGKLLDLLRRVQCFGIQLVKLDVRQESDRHTQALSELTQFLELGDYASWTEQERQAFLLAELQSKRPLIPTAWQPSADTQEVLDTCRMIALQPKGAITCYIISMARQPSDVLAVELLLKSAGMRYHLPVSPLFETLDDLNRAEQVIGALLAIPEYAQRLNGKMMVMIGYSDSAKDAGVLAASWAQYTAQESLLKLCSEADIKLTLFHGRGGTIGRGGAPAHAALLSQPPGTLKNGLRVTEQGEMIRTKLGLTGTAVKTLALYTSAILQANHMEPPTPKPEWRSLMEKLATNSCDVYRSYVRDNEVFTDYFRQATPEQELGKLPLGSRPVRRKPGGGIASLRAIPWIFAWTQNRLMLPAWLGAGSALKKVIEEGDQELLLEMAEYWPFFETRLSMLEMVFAKADLGLSEYYDRKLVSDDLQPLGDSLREQLESDIQTIKKLLGEDTLLQHQNWARESIQLRNIYTDPLNVLQVELLHRNRSAEGDQDTEQALMVTIAGIAAGMRNTG